MWELIRANRRKSMFLFLGMGLLLLILGYLIGYAFFPPEGGYGGIFIAAAIWSIMSMVAYFNGSSIILRLSNAKKVTPDVHPQLFNVVEEMKIAAGLPKIPEIYIINEEAPNAFATGRDPENSAIAVTAGLLSRLNRDELQGVIAHETSHILNRDIRYMTFSGIMLGSIVLLSEIFLRGMFFSSAGRYRSRSSGGGGQGQVIIMVLALVAAILAPIAAQLLYFAISRKREYLADASGARLTRYPEGLASALEKISMNSAELKSASKVTAPMYIVNPLKKKGMKMSDLTSTHPPISERINILRGMMHGVNYADYQEAYSKVKGTKATIIPGSGLHETEKVGIRESEGTVKETSGWKNQQREMGDIMMAVNSYSFINCTCGMKLKVPPHYDKKELRCPRCGRLHPIESK